MGRLLELLAKLGREDVLIELGPSIGEEASSARPHIRCRAGDEGPDLHWSLLRRRRVAGYFGSSKGDIGDSPQRGNRARLVPLSIPGMMGPQKGGEGPERHKETAKASYIGPGVRIRVLCWGAWDCFQIEQ